MGADQVNLLGVFGNPIEHSRSPQIHGLFAKSASLLLEYEKILVDSGKFKETAAAFLSRGASGFNITLPNKYDAYKLADKTTTNAKIAQAVNTIKVEVDGSLTGYNTDGPGLVQDISKRLGWPVEGKRLLVIGAGGAVQGVMSELLALKPASIHIYNRTESKALDLVLRLSDAGLNDGRLESRRLQTLSSHYDLVISGSSAGLLQNQDKTSGGSLSGTLSGSIIGPTSCCYDMIYGSKPTPFMDWCTAQGAVAVSDGLGMLIEQAALAFEIWFDKKVPTQPVYERVSASLSGA